MPLYSTRCPSCHQVGQIWRKVADRDDIPDCACGARLLREIVAPAIAPAFTPFQSPVTGKTIASREQYKEELARTGSIPLEPGVKQDIERRRQELIRKDEEKLDAAVDEVVTALNVSGRLDYATD